MQVGGKEKRKTLCVLLAVKKIGGNKVRSGTHLERERHH